MALEPEYFAKTNTWAIRGTLLASTAALTDGEWFDLQGFCPLAVTLEGTFDGEAQICVSNRPTQPPSTWHGAPLGSPVGDNGGTRTIDAPYRWLKVRITVYNAGALEAYAFGYKLGNSFTP